MTSRKTHPSKGGLHRAHAISTNWLHGAPSIMHMAWLGAGFAPLRLFVDMEVLKRAL
jgi:hypothetical protein